MKTKTFLLAITLAGVVFSGCEDEMYVSTPGNLVPKTVDQDPTLPSININGTQLHAETFGNKDSAMVIFLHGCPGSDYQNGLNAKQLADQGYYVVFYDQRGAGLSKRQNFGTYSIQQYLDDLTGVINYYRTSPSQKVFLFGHSWGAMLAAAYVNAYPDRIDGAIFAEPGGFNKEMAEEYSQAKRIALVFGNHQRCPVLRAIPDR